MATTKESSKERKNYCKSTECSLHIYKMLVINHTILRFAKYKNEK